MLADTATILRAQESMWPGYYQVELVVKDDQGQACPDSQKLKIQFCTCEDGLQCRRWGASGMGTKETNLGAAGIGLLLLGLLMLLCKCNGIPLKVFWIDIFYDMS